MTKQMDLAHLFKDKYDSEYNKEKMSTYKILAIPRTRSATKRLESLYTAMI